VEDLGRESIGDAGGFETVAAGGTVAESEIHNDWGYVRNEDYGMTWPWHCNSLHRVGVVWCWASAYDRPGCDDPCHALDPCPVSLDSVGKWPWSFVGLGRAWDRVSLGGHRKSLADSGMPGQSQ